MKTIRFAQHCHSEYSHDGESTFLEMVEKAKEQKIDFLFMTEHAEDLNPTLWAKFVVDCQNASQGIYIVPGLEFRTAEGPHILGLNLGLSPFYLAKTCVEACDWIRTQGGFSIIAHPDYYPYLLDPPCFDFQKVDAIEVWTAKADTQRCPRRRVISLYHQLKKTFPHLLPVAGLDAHGTYMLSTPCMLIEVEEGQNPLEAIRLKPYQLVGGNIKMNQKAEILQGQKIVLFFAPLFWFKKKLQRFAKRWRKWGLPELNFLRKLFRKAF